MKIRVRQENVSQLDLITLVVQAHLLGTELVINGFTLRHHIIQVITAMAEELWPELVREIKEEYNR